MQTRSKTFANMKSLRSKSGEGACNGNAVQKPGMGVHIANRTRSTYKARCQNRPKGVTSIEFHTIDDEDVPSMAVDTGLPSISPDVGILKKSGQTTKKKLTEIGETVQCRKRKRVEDEQTDRPRKRQRPEPEKSDNSSGIAKKKGRPSNIKIDYGQNEQVRKIEGRLKRGRPRKFDRAYSGLPRRRILDRKAKKVHIMSKEKMKEQEQHMVFNGEIRQYIKKLVKMEVQKQMGKLRKLEEREKWERKLTRTGSQKRGTKLRRTGESKKWGSEKSRMEALNINDDTEENEVLQDVEGNDRLIDIDVEQKDGLAIEVVLDTGKQSEDSEAENTANGIVKTKQRNKDSGDIQKGEQIPSKQEDFFRNQGRNLRGRSEENVDSEALWKEMEQAFKGDVLNSGSVNDTGMNFRNQIFKGKGSPKRQGPLQKTVVLTPPEDRQNKDSSFHMGSENVMKGEKAKNDNWRTSKKRRGSVLELGLEEITSPFQRVLLHVPKESQIPSQFDGGFQNREELTVKDGSKESTDLEDMWKDMELAFEGNLLSSLNDPSLQANSKYPRNSFEAESSMSDIGCCMGDHHEFILDEEIGIICQLCKFVKQEIRSILPPMIVNPRQKRSRDDWKEVDESFQQRALLFPDHKGSSCSNFPCHTQQSVWDIIPELKQNMYIHQQEGFEFLWKNLGGGLIPGKMKSPTSEEVGGCIISHAPGTGKTFLIISFLRTYLELFPESRILIVAPNSMLLPWQREFEKWKIDIPLYILNRTKKFCKEIFSDHENSEIVELIKNGKLEGQRNTNLCRLMMIYQWHRRTSVLAVSYNLFVYLTCNENLILPEEVRHIGKLLLESPSMLILDEGHQARNNYSKNWQALRKVNTKLRIILSGTLFQNNFTELFNTLYLVRPTFADRCLGACSQNSLVPGMVKDKTEFEEMTLKEKESRLRRVFMDEIGNKIQSGNEEFNLCLEKFRSMTDYFVHCYEGKVLNSLLGLRDFTVKLRPSSIQQTILEKLKRENNSQKINNLGFEIMVSSVSIHPSLYEDYHFQQIPFSMDVPDLETLRNDPNQGVKAKFVLDLTQLCQVMHEKVLLFSQNIPPFILLTKMFETHFSWRRGEEILQLDGTLSLDERQSIIDRFNDPTGEARVLFASIKASSEGITLTGASRVVFLDLVWNPATVKQAVSRAFRLGQKKLVYVYRLIVSGTLEEEKYHRTVWKDCLSKLIFTSIDHGNPDASENTHKIHCEDKILDKLVELDRDTKTFHTIFEHSELRGRKDPRSRVFS